MSDEEEENSAEEEEEENEEEEGEDEEEQDEDEDEEGDDEDGDEDEDEEGEGEGEDGQDQDQEQEGSGGGSNQESEEPKDKLPKFRSIEPDEFKISNVLSEISSLSISVDHFINTLPSHGGGSYYRSYNPPPLRTSMSQLPIMPRQQPKVVIMKDEDTQVSMQPQIIIQPTKVQKPPVEPSYQMSNESTKFLAQLYEDNKKLKRWQNSSHNTNSHQVSSGNGFYGSRERFQRQQYEKGLFNVEERNRQIDQAIEMLKREQD